MRAMRSCFDADCGRAYLLFLWLIAAIDSPVLAATIGRARLLGLLLLLSHGPARGLGLVGRRGGGRLCGGRRGRRGVSRGGCGRPTR